MTQIRILQCQRCPARFKGRKRGLCPKCQTAAAAAKHAQRQQRYRQRQAKREPYSVRNLAHEDHRSVGEAVGLSPTTVLHIERRALEKLRSKHPELLVLYRQWVADGSPRPPKIDAGTRLLGFQEQIVEWTGFAEDLRAQGRPDFAAEVEAHIEKCQAALANELRRQHA